MGSVSRINARAGGWLSSVSGLQRVQLLMVHAAQRKLSHVQSGVETAGALALLTPPELSEGTQDHRPLEIWALPRSCDLFALKRDRSLFSLP